MSGAAPDPQPSRASGLLSLVRALINYGRHLATTFRSNPHKFDASDIALILAHITRGLLRAEALEVRIIRDAVRLDAPSAPTPRAVSHRKSPPARTATPSTETAEALVPGFDLGMPTPEQIAAEVRRRPIGAVIADICRDLGIMPNHPLWAELSVVIIRFGGNLAKLVKDICERAFRFPAPPWPLPRISRRSCNLRHRPAQARPDPALRPPQHQRDRLRPVPPFRRVPAGDYSSSR